MAPGDSLLASGPLAGNYLGPKRLRLADGSLLILFLLLFGLSQTSIAGPVRPLSLESLIDRADVILHGVVRSKQCLRDPEGRIYTRLEVSADEVWKGTARATPMIIVHGGGVVGEESVVVSDQARYAVGEEVVAFLRINSRQEGVTISLSQGKFTVLPDRATGEKFVASRYHGVGALLDDSPRRDLVAARSASDRLNWTLGQFRTRVESRLAARSESPELGERARNQAAKLAVALAHTAAIVPLGW